MLLRACERLAIDPERLIFKYPPEMRMLVLGYERLRQAEDSRDERLRLEVSAGTGAGR